MGGWVAQALALSLRDRMAAVFYEAATYEKRGGLPGQVRI